MLEREGGGRSKASCGFVVWFTPRSELECLGVGAGGERASDASCQYDRNPAAPGAASPRAAGAGGRLRLVQLVHPDPAQEALQDEADEERAEQSLEAVRYQDSPSSSKEYLQLPSIEITPSSDEDTPWSNCSTPSASPRRKRFLLRKWLRVREKKEYSESR